MKYLEKSRKNFCKIHIIIVNGFSSAENVVIAGTIKLSRKSLNPPLYSLEILTLLVPNALVNFFWLFNNWITRTNEYKSTNIDNNIINIVIFDEVDDTLNKFSQLLFSSLEENINTNTEICIGNNEDT